VVDYGQIEESLRQPARAALSAIDETEVVGLLQDLIRAKSVNPPGDVREGVRICEEKLSSSGFVTRIAAIDETRPNLIAKLGGSSPVLCFNAHLDTVPAGDLSAWTHDPFGGEVVEGRIYGRGAGDDKASVTAQVIAGVAIARACVPLNGQLVITAVADEEIGGRAGAVQLFEQGGLTPDWVIVGEQTLGRVCVGEKGGAACRVHVRGSGAHASMPWLGANAIDATAEIIIALKRDLFPRLSERTHPLFFPSTGAITTIAGGVKENIIPDACSIYIDRRLVPGETPDGCRTEIDEIVQSVVRSLPGIEATVVFDDPTEVWAASATDADAAVVRAMTRANAALGLSTEPTGFSAMTDGRYFTARGFPTIIYGPGDVNTAHTADEWVGVDEVVSAARAYALAAVHLLR
jgi:succinyl-diaminopimelate desuccinylase